MILSSIAALIEMGLQGYLTRGEEDKLLEELNPLRPIVFANGRAKGCAYRITSGVAQRQMQDNYDLVVLLLDTGARYSEGASLLWSDIDVISWETIKIYRPKVQNEGVLRMTSRLREVLKRRRAKDPKGTYVFQGYAKKGGVASRGKSTKAIHHAIERAGLNNTSTVQKLGRVTLHTLRHTFASRLVQNGATLFEVQHLLGHADTRMTERYAYLVQSRTESNCEQGS